MYYIIFIFWLPNCQNPNETPINSKVDAEQYVIYTLLPDRLCCQTQGTDHISVKIILILTFLKNLDHQFIPFPRIYFEKI